MIGPPPPGGETYVEIAVRFAAAGGRVEARVETRAGDAEWQAVALPLAAGEGEELAHRALLDACVPGRGDEPARRLGRALFTGLFHGPALERYRAAQGPARTAAPPLRLRFHLGAGNEAERALQRLPWELLAEPAPGGGRLLALDRRLSVVRHLTIGDGVAPMARPPRLRVLVAAAEGRAPGVPPLDLGGEIAAIRAGCPPGGAVDVEALRPATLDGLIERLRDGGFHVLHLSGHGDVGGEDGVVLLPDDDGRLVPRGGEQLAQLLGGLSPLRLVVLNACRTAETVAQRPFAGVATALLAHGLPAAIAMQAPIGDGAAARFAAVLYARLAAGAGLDAAVAEGRLAISSHRPRTFEWAVPVLFSRLPGGELFAAPAAPAVEAAERQPRTAREPRWRTKPIAATVLLAAAILAFLALWGLPAALRDAASGPAGEVAAPADDAGAPEPAAEAGEEDERPGEEDGEDGSSAPPADVAGLLGSVASQPSEEPPGDHDDHDGPNGPSASPAEPPAAPAPFCGPTRVLRSGEPAELPELDARLVAEVRERPDLGPYVTVSLLGPAFDVSLPANRRQSLDFRPAAPVVVSLLAFDHVAGSVHLACRVVTEPP